MMTTPRSLALTEDVSDAETDAELLTYRACRNLPAGVAYFSGSLTGNWALKGTGRMGYTEHEKIQEKPNGKDDRYDRVSPDDC